MSLEPEYRRKRIRYLSLLLRDARHKAARSLLKGQAGQAQHYQACAKDYANELSVLHKPPYWHRVHRDAWMTARTRTESAGWSGTRTGRFRNNLCQETKLPMSDYFHAMYSTQVMAPSALTGLRVSI